MEKVDPLLIDAAVEGASLQVVSTPRLKTSYNAGWDHILLEHFVHGPLECPDYQCKQHALLIHLQDEPGSERKMDDRLESEDIHEGDVVLIPSLVNCWGVSRAPAEGITLALEPEFVAHNVRELIDPERIELIPQFARPDPFIAQVGHSLLAELQTTDSGSKLYVEALSNALAVHLVRHYATIRTAPKQYVDGLSVYQLRRAQEFIADNLNQKIGLADIAEVLGISQYYFSHLFRQSIGTSPYRYVIQQRVERAKTLLRSRRELSITDIALECGFSHPSHLSRHFKQLTGITPSLYRQQ